MSGGFQGAYADSGEAYLSHVCFVKGIRCWADEAKFGGIVIQPQPDPVSAKINSWHVSVAAESIVASLFARIGYDVSVQYGANQPEYDLSISQGDRMAKVSVKGSRDGSWGLTQKYLKGLTKADYHGAIEKWEAAHSRKTLFALVQFKGVSLHELPRVYLAAPTEIAERLRATSKGKGDTILHEYKVWASKAHGAGTIDAVPDSWRFTQARVEQLLSNLQ